MVTLFKYSCNLAILGVFFKKYFCIRNLYLVPKGIKHTLGKGSGGGRELDFPKIIMLTNI